MNWISQPRSTSPRPRTKNLCLIHELAGVPFRGCRNATHCFGVNIIIRGSSHGSGTSHRAKDMSRTRACGLNPRIPHAVSGRGQEAAFDISTPTGLRKPEMQAKPSDGGSASCDGFCELNLHKPLCPVVPFFRVRVPF